jgi:hypothetical protein
VLLPGSQAGQDEELRIGDNVTIHGISASVSRMLLGVNPKVVDERPAHPEVFLGARRRWHL